MAGGFQSTRKAGDFPSTGRTATHGGAGTGEVDTVNGVSPDSKGNVQLTASDVGSYGKGESEQKFEPKRATGLIDQTVDPTTKPEGDYYVTEKFIGAPTIASGSYVGVMRINLDFDGSDNGGLIEYYADGVMYYKVKFTGGWSGWVEVPKAQAAMARTLSTLSSEEQTLEARVAELEKHSAAPKPAVFNPDEVALTGGYADNWRDAVHVSTHKTGSPITITKLSDDAHNAVVMMSPEEARHVVGVTIDGGLPAKWESHAVTIDGKQYAAFISPYKLTKHPLNIGIVWG